MCFPVVVVFEFVSHDANVSVFVFNVAKFFVNGLLVVGNVPAEVNRCLVSLLPLKVLNFGLNRSLSLLILDISVGFRIGVLAFPNLFKTLLSICLQGCFLFGFPARNVPVDCLQGKSFLLVRKFAILPHSVQTHHILLVDRLEGVQINGNLFEGNWFEFGAIGLCLLSLVVLLFFVLCTLLVLLLLLFAHFHEIGNSIS